MPFSSHKQIHTRKYSEARECFDLMLKSKIKSNSKSLHSSFKHALKSNQWNSKIFREICIWNIVTVSVFVVDFYVLSHSEPSPATSSTKQVVCCCCCRQKATIDIYVLCLYRYRELENYYNNQAAAASQNVSNRTKPSNPINLLIINPKTSDMRPSHNTRISLYG